MTGDGDDEDELDKMFNDILNDSNKSKQTNVSAKNKTEQTSPIKMPAKGLDLKKHYSVNTVSEFSS